MKNSSMITSFFWKIFVFAVSWVWLFAYFLINFIFVFCISFVYFGLFLLRVSLTKKKIDGNILFYKKVWGYCSFFFCIFLRNFYRVVFFSLFYNNHNKISSLLYVELLIFLKKLTIRLNIFVSLGKFFFRKTKEWFFSAFFQGSLYEFWNFSIYVSFFIYIALLYFIYIFFGLFCFILLQLYIYLGFFFIIYCISIYLFIFFKYLFSYVKFVFNVLFWDSIVEFVWLLNLMYRFINAFLISQCKFFISNNLNLNGNKESVKFRKEILSFFLLLVNLNNAKILEYFSRKKNLSDISTQTVAGLHKSSFESHSLLFSANLQKTEGFLEFILNTTTSTSSLFNSTQSLFLLNLLKWYVQPSNLKLFVNMRNLLNKTETRANSLEFNKFLKTNQKGQTSSKAFDMLMGTTWLNTAEPVIVDSLTSSENKYRYYQKYQRPIRLIYSFFKTHILSPVFWPTIFSFIKHQRFIKMGRRVPFLKFVDVYKNRIQDNVMESNKESFLIRKFNNAKSASGKWDDGLDVSDNLFRVLVFQLPFLFSFLSQLNYMLFLLFAELFGALFDKLLLFSSHAFLIRFQLENTINLNWKFHWFLKIFLFLVWDLWKQILKGFLVCFFFFKNVIFGGNFFNFFFSWSLQFLTFLLQYLHLDNTSLLRTSLLTHKYVDFFKYKFDLRKSEKSYFLKFGGVIGFFLEKCVFFFLFLFFIAYDLIYILGVIGLKYKFIYFFVQNVDYLYRLCLYSLGFCLSNLADFWFFCSYISQQHQKCLTPVINKKYEHLGSRWVYLYPVERFVVDLFLWKYYITKYWWNVTIEHEKGLKKIPFLFKYSKKFQWFDSFLFIGKNSKNIFFWVCIHLKKIFSFEKKSGLPFSHSQKWDIFGGFFHYIYFNFCYGCILLIKSLISFFIWVFFSRKKNVNSCDLFFSKKNMMQKEKIKIKEDSWQMFSVSSSNFTGFRFFKKIKESSSFFKTQQGVNVSHPRFCYNFSINSSRINTAQELLREVYTSSSLNDRYTKKTIEKDSFRSMDNILFIELALSRFREKSTYKKKFFFYFFRSLGEFQRDPAFCYNFKNLKMLQKIFYLFDSKKKKSLLDFKNINGTNAAIRYLSLRKQTNYLNTDRIKSSNLSLDMQLFSKFCNYFVKILKMSSFLKELTFNALRKEPMVDVLESFYLGINNWFSTTTVKDFSFIKNNSFFFKKKEFPIASSRYEHTNHNIVNVFFLNLFLIFNENKYILYSKKKKSYNSFIFSRDFQNDTIFQSLWRILYNAFQYERVLYIQGYTYIMYIFQKFFFFNFVNFQILNKRKPFLTASVLKEDKTWFFSNTCKFILNFTMKIWPFFFGVLFFYYQQIFQKTISISITDNVIRILKTLNWTFLNDLSIIIIFGLNNYMYKHVLCFPDKEFSANYPIILKALFSTDFDIYIKRYSFYVYDSLNRELSKLVKVIHLSLNQAFSEKTSEMGNEEILFSEYVTKSEKKSLQEENLFSNMQWFQVSQNLPRRVRNMINHNVFWFEKITNIHMDFQPLYEGSAKRKMISPFFFEKTFKVDFNLYFDYVWFMFTWLNFKWNMKLYVFYFKSLFHFSNVRLYLWGLLFVFFMMFGFCNVFLLDLWVVFFTLIFSWVKFLILSFSSVLFSVFSLFDVLDSNTFRETYEIFFYNYSLQMPFYQRLVALDLYSVFVFLFNYLGLYEDAGFNLSRFILVLYINTIIFVPYFFYDFVTYFLFSVNFLMVIFGDIILSVLPVQADSVWYFISWVCWKSFSLIFFVGDLCLYNFFLSFFWQMLFFFEYGWDLLYLYFIYFYMIIMFFFDVFFLKWIWMVFQIFQEINEHFIHGIWSFCSLDVRVSHFFNFFTYIVYFDFLVVFDIWRYTICTLSSQLVAFFAKGWWTLLYIFFSTLHFVWECFVVNIYNSAIFIKNLFFNDFIIADFIVFSIQFLFWLYLNLIYYVVLWPFFAVLYSFFFFFKTVLLLPLILVKGISLLITCCFNVVSCIAVFCSFIIHSIFDTVMAVISFGVFYIYFPLMRCVTIVWYNLTQFVVIFPFMMKIVTGMLYYIHLFLAVLINPLFSVVYFCWYYIGLFCYPIWWFLCKIWLMLCYIIKYYNFILILLKEISLLFVFIFFKIFKIFLLLGEGILNVLIVCLEIFDEMFPNFKNIFKPFGGMSIFYATLYYYIFVWIAVLWSYSFRVFNDTYEEPPVPDQAWVQSAEFFEAHPVYQRLPLDVYRLLFSERLCSDFINMPRDLKDSLEIWTSVDESVTFSTIRIKETPLNLQGYYYMLLNDMAKKYIISFYKKKLYIIQAYKSTFFPWLSESIWNTIGYMKTRNALWKTYAQFYERLVTEEDMEYFESSFEIIKTQTKWEKLTSLTDLMEQFEFWFKDDVRKQRAMEIQAEKQEFYEKFGAGTADEMIWSFPVIGKWFGNQRLKDIENDYKLVVFNVGVKQGITAVEKYEQKEAKRRFISNWLNLNKKQEENIFKAKQTINGFSYSEINGIRNYMSQREHLIEREDDKSIDPDFFIIKKYKKIYLNDNDDVNPDFAMDPFFIGVRFLDLFLYPILVFATVNTGWWYSANGFMDSIMRYVSLEGYSSKIAESFLKEIEKTDKILDNNKLSEFNVFNVRIYDSDDFVSAFIPQKINTLDTFIKEHPELVENTLLDDNPAVFINNAFKYFQIHQQQPFEWFEQIYGNHIFDTIMAEHNQIVEDYQNDLREYEDKASMNDVSLYKIFNKPFIDFLYEIYEPSLIKESFHWFTEIGKERPASLPGQLLNKWEELPDISKRPNFSFMELIKGITQPSSFDEMTTTQEDLSFEVSSSYMNEEHLSLGLNMSNEAENDGSLKKWSLLFEQIHPIHSERRQRQLLLRYHAFHQTNLFDDLWVSYYPDINDMIKESFIFVDRTQNSLSFIPDISEKSVSSLSFNKDSFRRELFFRSNQLNALEYYNVPIVRQSNLPWSDKLWLEVVDLESSLKSLDNIRNSIDTWQDFWLNYLRNHKVNEISSIAEDIKDEILFGDLIYQYYSTGFLGFVHKTTMQRLIWSFFKVYEDTFIGKLGYQFLRHIVMRRYSTGIEMSPYVIHNLDSNNSLLGVSPFFVISDVKYLKSDFFNMYTNFSAYTHFGPQMLQRMALTFFFKPEFFDNIWFNKMLADNFYVALDTLIDHVKEASYIYPEMYRDKAEADRMILLKWLLLERWKNVVEFVYFFNSQVLKALTDIGHYGLSFNIISSVYTTIAEPIMGLYALTQQLLLTMHSFYQMIKNLSYYVFIEWHLLNRVAALGLYITIPLRHWAHFILTLFLENVKGFLFFFDTSVIHTWGFSHWWEYTLIRGLPLLWYEFVSSLFLCFANLEINEDLFFFFRKWPSEFWEQNVVFVFLSLVEGYISNFGDRLGFFFLLNSPLYFPVTSVFYAFNWGLVFNAFWVTLPFLAPFFWMNVLSYFTVLSEREEMYLMRYWFRHKDTFMIEWAWNSFDTFDDILLKDSWIYFHKYSTVSTKYLNFRNSLNDDEFSKDVNDFYFLNSEKLRPILGREGIEAPFSFLSQEGLLVFSLQEVEYISDLYLNSRRGEKLYYAIDFFKEYTNYAGYDELSAWYEYCTLNTPTISLMKPFDNSKMFPKFTFLKEIGPDFYLNLRSYEETFTLVNLRYFFHRYQELINHTLSVGQIFEKGYSETILERKYMYGGVPYTKSSFEKDDDRTVMNLEGKSRWVYISQDIYGNMIYLHVYKKMDI